MVDDDRFERQLDEVRKRFKHKVLGRGGVAGIWENDLDEWEQASLHRQEQIYGIWVEELLEDLRDIFG